MGTNPDSDDVDLHGHKESIQDHQKGRDAEPQILESDAELCKLPQLDGLGDERQHPVDEEDYKQSGKHKFTYSQLKEVKTDQSFSLFSPLCPNGSSLVSLD